MPAKKTLEIACFNLSSVMIAADAGADRIELCENYKEGGVTPSHSQICKVREKIGLPLHVIIRPRGGDFIYNKTELEQMEQNILFCRAQGIDGVVLGALTAENKIDQEACQRLAELASPMSVTFHRAIDSCADTVSAFELLISMKVNRVLTSGGTGNAVEHVQKLKKLQEQFGNAISIMPGGGIRASNFARLTESGCSEFHSAAITGDGDMADASEIRQLKKLLSQ